MKFPSPASYERDSEGTHLFRDIRASGTASEIAEGIKRSCNPRKASFKSSRKLHQAITNELVNSKCHAKVHQMSNFYMENGRCSTAYPHSIAYWRRIQTTFSDVYPQVLI